MKTKIEYIGKNQQVMVQEVNVLRQVDGNILFLSEKRLPFEYCGGGLYTVPSYIFEIIKSISK